MRHRKLLIFAASALALGPARAPLAQEAPSTYSLGEVVVTATRTEVPISEIGVSATVITAEDLERRQTKDVADVLADVTGFTVVRQGSRGSTASLFPRGGEENYTLVMIDGVQVNLGGGAFNFGTLTTDNIERIEVIRGPQSALYGSDAIGGVIHIITKAGAGRPSATVSTVHGAHSENGHYVGESKFKVTAGTSRAGISLAYGRVDDHGILDVNNDYWNNTVSGRVDLYPLDLWTVTLTARFEDSLFEFPTENAGDRFDVLDPNQEERRKDVASGFQTSVRPFEWWEHSFQFGFHYNESKVEDPLNPEADVFATTDTFSKNEQHRFTYDYHFNLYLPQEGSVTSVFTAGVEYDREEFDQESFFFEFSALSADRDNVAYYVQEQLSLFDRVHLVGGVRVEDNSEFGTSVNPRGSVALNIRETGTKLRGSVGTGIKEPTFVENFGRFSFFLGNPDLDPEEAFSWEVGVDQALFSDRLVLGLTYFQNEYDDLISSVFASEPVPASPTVFNVQAAESRGVEIEARVQPGYGLTLRTAYTYLDTEVTDDGGLNNLFFKEGEPLLRRPKHTFSFAVDWLGGPWDVNLNGKYVGKRDDSDFSDLFNPRRVENGSYFVVNLAAAYALPVHPRVVEEIKVLAKANNLLDRDYEEVYGFSSPGASFLAGLEATF